MIRIFILLAFIFIFPDPVQAQFESNIYNQGTGFVNRAEEARRRLEREGQPELGIIVPRDIIVSLIRYKGLKDTQFALELTIAESVTGCVELSPINYEVKTPEPRFLDIKVFNYKREEKRRAIGEDCKNEAKRPSSVIVMDLPLLERLGTEVIRFQSPNGNDNYTLNVTDAKVELMPQSRNVFRADPRTSIDGVLTYWFNTGDVVALTVALPLEDKIEGDFKDNIQEQLTEIARKNGLFRLDDVNPDYVPPSGADPNTFYFADPEGKLSEELSTNDMLDVGFVRVAAEYDTVRGVEKRFRNFPVFARPLGLFE